MAIGTKQLAPSELDTFEDQRLVEELRTDRLTPTPKPAIP